MQDITIIKDSEYDMKDYDHINSKNKQLMYQKIFVEDVETGVTIKRIIYPAGCIIPEHTHHAAHGCYVLQGILHTNVGDFGPGDFVWFKEGVKMFHGGDTEDVDLLFISNKKLDMVYL